MKKQWQKFAARIDAFSLRERVMIFAAIAVVMLAAINAALIEPQFEKQKQLSQKLNQTQEQVAKIHAEIQQKVKERQIDPDAANRGRLQQLKQQSGELQNTLLDMQKGLVSPDRMARLLDDILKRNGRLALVSLKTLPAVNVNEPAAAEAKPEADKSGAAVPQAKDKTQAAVRVGAVYRHGVEIALQGEYLDMLNYVTQLEALPWQIFWGRAKLEVNEYPKATLTLTLYTLSLDRKWMNL